MLHTPYTLRCGVVIPNRIALAPMTNLQSLPDGTLGDDELHWLARRADGGFGLVETCAAYVALDGKAWHGELGVDRDEDLPGLTRLATRVQAGGAVGIVQLFHGGVRADSKLTGQPVWSASAFHEDAPGFEVPRAATPRDVDRVVTDFVAAAVRCQKAGWHGIELHGAHGYLLCQFLSRTMNPGKSLEERAWLTREITRRIRGVCGPRFVVGVRLSLEDRGQTRGVDLDESLQVARWLCDDGADFIHASLWNAAKPTAKRPHEHPIPLLRAALPEDVAVIACGAIWSVADAEAALARGADLVALGRAAILNPDWPRLSAQPGYEPRQPPMSRAEVLERAVSPLFASYLMRWKNLLTD